MAWGSVKKIMKYEAKFQTNAELEKKKITPVSNSLAVKYMKRNET